MREVGEDILCLLTSDRCPRSPQSRPNHTHVLTHALLSHLRTSSSCFQTSRKKRPFLCVCSVLPRYLLTQKLPSPFLRTSSSSAFNSLVVPEHHFLPLRPFPRDNNTLPTCPLGCSEKCNKAIGPFCSSKLPRPSSFPHQKLCLKSCLGSRMPTPPHLPGQLRRRLLGGPLPAHPI